MFLNYMFTIMLMAFVIFAIPQVITDVVVRLRYETSGPYYYIESAYRSEKEHASYRVLIGSIVLFVIYLLSFIFGARLFPTLYKPFYRDQTQTAVVDEIEYDTDLDYFGIHDFRVTYVCDDQSTHTYFPCKNTNLYLSDTGEAYFIRCTRTTKTFWGSLLTPERIREVVDIYLPEKEYQELQETLASYI